MYIQKGDKKEEEGEKRKEEYEKDKERCSLMLYATWPIGICSYSGQ